MCYSGGGDTFFLSLLWCMCSILSSSLCEFLSLFLHPEHIKNSSISFNQKSMNRSIYRKDMVHHRLLHVNHPAQVSTPCVWGYPSIVYNPGVHSMCLRKAAYRVQPGGPHHVSDRGKSTTQGSTPCVWRNRSIEYKPCFTNELATKTEYYIIPKTCINFVRLYLYQIT